ncbi:hypothetical protein [Diplocloster hominis]|uniref:hypothetical protein n=1 Tax=Diplocloster hominis TaxID=3079010 RepID=UPI0031BB177E
MNNVVMMTKEELKNIAEEAAKQAIKEYKKEEAKEKKKDKYHDTFAVMKIYRDVAIHIEKSICEGEQLKLEGMTEAQKHTYIQSIRSSKIKSMLMTSHIDIMVNEIYKRRQQEGREVEYKAFELYFFEGKTYEVIAKELQCGYSSPRRWVTGILRELSPLLWGYEVLKL